MNSAVATLLLHFICTDVRQVYEVIDLLDRDELVYGITILPSSCQWTREFEMVGRLGTLIEVIDYVDRGGLPDAVIGLFTMPAVSGIVYSAGMMNIG